MIRERDLYWQPTGPSPLISRPALIHGSLNSLFQVALYLPSYERMITSTSAGPSCRGSSRKRDLTEHGSGFGVSAFAIRGLGLRVCGSGVDPAKGNPVKLFLLRVLRQTHTLSALTVCELHTFLFITLKHRFEWYTKSMSFKYEPAS